MTKQTLLLDSSQISTFYECAQKWNLYYNNNLTLINKKDPSLTFQPSDAIAAGSLGHKYLEIYYTQIGRGISPQESVRLALDFNPDTADKQDVVFPLDTKLRDLVKRRFCDYIMTYSHNDYEVAVRRRPAITVDDNGMLIDSYRLEPLIEKGFSYKLFESSEYLFILEGRIDWICRANGNTMWADHKWQLRSHRLYNKCVQFKNYAMVTGLPLGVINYIRLQDKVGSDTFERQPISFNTVELEHWKQELIEKYIEISKSVARGEFAYNRDSCNGKYGKFCMFTPLCEEYNLQTRSAVQARDYTKKKEWKPW